MMERLPDKLDQNGRVEIRVDGTVVGTRRIVDFRTSGSPGNSDDGGLNDKVTVDFSGFGGGGSHYEDLFGAGYDATGAWVGGPTSIWSGNDFTVQSWMSTNHTATGWDLVFGFGGGNSYTAFYTYDDPVGVTSFHGIDLLADAGSGTGEFTATATADGTGGGVVLDLTSPAGAIALSASNAVAIISVNGVSSQASHLLDLQIGGANKHFFTETHAVLKAPASDPSADLVNGSLTFWLNEAGNLLTFQVKYSGGTAKTGTVALV
jgi:hypothetical protein